MPKPTPRTYHVEASGAKCSDCPLNCKGKLPVPPTHVENPVAVIVAECPGSEEKYQGKAMVGRASKRLMDTIKTATRPNGLYTVLYRIACCPPQSKRTESIMRKAAVACLPRYQAEVKRYNAVGLHQLFLGKWAPVGALRAYEYNQPLEIKLTTGVMRNRSMVLPHPSLAYFNKPALRESFQISLGRFVQSAQGELTWPAWPERDILLGPSPEALAALRSMGPVIAYDTETLGTDPLTAPITAIGISDGAKTVSIGWCSYENRHGYFQGIADSKSPLAASLREAIKAVLESSRTMVAHNGSYDLLGLQTIGIEARVDLDTLDAYKIVNPELPANLEAVAAHLLCLAERWKTLFRAGRDDDAKGSDEFADSHRDALLNYNARDTLVTRWLHDPLVSLLATED